MCAHDPRRRGSHRPGFQPCASPCTMRPKPHPCASPCMCLVSAGAHSSEGFAAEALRPHPVMSMAKSARAARRLDLRPSVPSSNDPSRSTHPPSAAARPPHPHPAARGRGAPPTRRRRGARRVATWRASRRCRSGRESCRSLAWRAGGPTRLRRTRRAPRGHVARRTTRRAARRYGRRRGPRRFRPSWCPRRGATSRRCASPR